MAKDWAERAEIIERRLAEDDFAMFTKWPTICESFFTGPTPEARRAYRSIKDDRILGAIKDPGIGNPLLLADTDTSGTYAQQGFYLHMLERNTNIDIRDISSVIEVGGGYGAMYYLFRSLGFSGEYTIFDLPEIHGLQKKYIDEVGLRQPTMISSLDTIEDNYTLLIALCSLSEIDPISRAEIMSKISAEYFVISGQSIWDGWDNNSWFHRWLDDCGADFDIYKAPHPNHFYITGSTNE